MVFILAESGFTLDEFSDFPNSEAPPKFKSTPRYRPVSASPQVIFFTNLIV